MRNSDETHSVVALTNSSVFKIVDPIFVLKPKNGLVTLLFSFFFNLTVQLHLFHSVLLKESIIIAVNMYFRK